MDEEESDIDDDFWPAEPDFKPIPDIFHSLEFDGPFRECLICRTKLWDPDCSYFIERIFRGQEPIVEYAMCNACREELRTELSEQSVKALDAWARSLDYQGRLERLYLLRDLDDPLPWLDECIITGTKRAECQGYQIVGLCRGERMEFGMQPYMVSNDAIEEMTKLLSKTTRDRLDDFTGENFGLPPEFCEHPNFSPLLI